MRLRNHVNRAHMAYDHVVFNGFGGGGGVNSQARTSVAVSRPYAFMVAARERRDLLLEHQSDLNSTMELPGIVAQPSRYFPHVLQIGRGAFRAVFQLTGKEFSQSATLA